MARLWIGLGSLTGLLGVAMAAFAAHGLGRLDPVDLQMVRSAIEMQFWHTFALLACGLWQPRGGRWVDFAGIAFALGIVAFCGAVYALALFGLRLPVVAPAGGWLLMLGWILLGVSAIRARQYTSK